MTGEVEDAALAFLLKLGPASQLEVLARYEEVLQFELDSTPRRLRRIALALHQVRRILGRSPSLREYKRLRRKYPERGWPDPRSVTRWLGVRSWNDALVRLRLEPVLEGDVIEHAIGPVYTVEEVIEAVRACAVDLGRVPTITDYLAWQRRPDVRDRPGRRPASTWTFNRIFGGFPAARVAAGLVEDEPTAAHPSDLLLRTANYRLTDEQIIDDIRCAAERTDGLLTAIVYDRERRSVYLETREAGRPRALAGVGTIYRHFRTWTAALEAAGIDDSRRTASVGNRREKKPRFSNAQLLRALREGQESTEGLLTVGRYVSWRKSELERNPRRSTELPGEATFFRRFGGWTAALEAAGLQPWSRYTSGGNVWTRERVIEALRAQAAEYGRANASRDRVLTEAAKRRFGSWSQACAAAEVMRVGKGSVARTGVIHPSEPDSD
jgi:Homing endonuclease associated repeat